MPACFSWLHRAAVSEAEAIKGEGRGERDMVAMMCLMRITAARNSEKEQSSISHPNGSQRSTVVLGRITVNARSMKVVDELDRVRSQWSRSCYLVGSEPGWNAAASTRSSSLDLQPTTSVHPTGCSRSLRSRSRNQNTDLTQLSSARNTWPSARLGGTMY